MKWKSMFLAIGIGIAVQLILPMWVVFGISILAVIVALLVLVATEIYLAGKENDEIDEVGREKSVEDDDFEEEIEI